MKVEKNKYYNIKCDCCGQLLDPDSYWDDGLEEMADECSWKALEPDKHYCPDCYSWDDEGHLVTKDGKKWDECGYEITDDVRRRLQNANTFCLCYFILMVLTTFMCSFTISDGKPYGLLFFGGVFLLSAWRFCHHMQERKVFRDYLEKSQKLYD